MWFIDSSLSLTAKLFMNVCDPLVGLACFKWVHNVFFLSIADMEGKLREKIREWADHFYDVTLPWIKMMKFIYETT
jgi:hypothetical protein